MVGTTESYAASGAASTPTWCSSSVYLPGGAVKSELWDWLQRVLSGVRPVVRYDGTIEVLDPSGNDVVATWVFDRGLPAKISGPQLNAKTGEIAIEELTISHEGLRLRS